MKSIKLLAILLLAGVLSASAQSSDVNLSKSIAKWTGNKIGGSHYGEIKIQSGFIELKDGDIVGGKIVMDMNSITNTDIKKQGQNEKLIGHLKSDDFFGVKTYPTSSFQITSASKFNEGKATVEGVLTIKGKTESITFDVLKSGNTYSAQLKVDRSKYDVRYGSNSFFDSLGDKAIDDIFILDIQIVL